MSHRRCNCRAVSVFTVDMPDGKEERMCQECRSAWKTVEELYDDLQQDTLRQQAPGATGREVDTLEPEALQQA